MKENTIIERLREIFKADINLVMEINGHNYENAEFVMESALDLALNDIRNEFYK